MRTAPNAMMALALTLAAAVSPAPGGWDVTQPKWVQQPDFRPLTVIPGSDPMTFAPPGIDVKATSPKVLADDFLCTEPGYVTEVHVWGSWKDDILPSITTKQDNGHTSLTISGPSLAGFRISFHADIPAAADLHSRPADPPLWQALIPPASYYAVWITPLIPEGWYDPDTAYYDASNHELAFLYYFDLRQLLQSGQLTDPDTGEPIRELFRQDGSSTAPKVYWLGIEALPYSDPLPQPPVFGWKTSVDHWGDAAAWKDRVARAGWNEVRYPDGHPYAGQPVDLAFVIVPEPATLGLLALGGLAMVRRRR